MKKTLAILLILAVVMLTPVVFTACDDDSYDPTPTPSEPGFDLAANEDLYDSIITSQETYLKSLQLNNGAICKWSPASTNLVNPYFACFAALALLENPNNAATVKRYCDWHFSALNKTEDANGGIYTIYDYNVNGETLTSTNDYDSSDSYAALFLMVLEKYLNVTSDSAYIVAHSADIAGVYGAMLSTRGSSTNANLTAAKPNYEVYYLMDNSEVYAGCSAAAVLFNTLGDQNAKNAALSAASQTVSGIEGLYSSIYKAFRSNAGTYTVNKSAFYPDMAAQVYPVAFGAILPTSTQGAAAYDFFKSKFDTAAKIDAGVDFPWIIIAYAAYFYEDYEFATAILNYADTQFIAPGNTYPWYCMEGAMAYLTASNLKAEI